LDAEGTGTLPLYPYRCTQCGHKFEKIQHFNSEPEKVCPQCGGVLERTLTAPGLSFKGAGWYVNDYASKPSSSASENKADGKSEAKTEAKTETKSETKSESKAPAAESGSSTTTASTSAAPAATPKSTKS
jgi:putative FmdB family regulatory protein